jgi:hypothetical protein
MMKSLKESSDLLALEEFHASDVEKQSVLWVDRLRSLME